MKKKVFVIGFILFLTNVLSQIHCTPEENDTYFSEWTLEQAAANEGSRRMNSLRVDAVTFPFGIVVQGSSEILGQRMVTVRRVEGEIGTVIVR